MGRDDLGETTVLDVLLPIEEPVGNLELAGVGDNHHERLELRGGNLTGPLVDVDFGLLASKDGETATNTSDGSHSERELLLAINIGVDNTQNVLEVIGTDERHDERKKVSRRLTVE